MAQKTTSAWTSLQRKSASLRRSVEQLVRSFAELAGSEGADTISGSVIAKTELEYWTRILASAGEMAETAAVEIGRRASGELEALEERLVRSLRDTGLNVYGETTLLIVDGIVHVEIDKEKPAAKVNSKTVADMSVDGLTKTVLEEMAHVRKAVTPPEKFLGLLLRAYESERLQSGKEFGSQVQVSTLLCQLAMLRQNASFRSNPTAKNFSDYPRDNFRADLFQLLESNLIMIDGKVFRYASGSDTAGAIFLLVPQLGRTAHIGRIWFEHGNQS